MRIVSNNKGMTAVEFIIALMIVALLSIVLYDVLREGTNIWKYEDVQANMFMQAREAMDKMVREIRQAKTSTIVITPLDANRDKIQFSAPLELENPDDIQTIIYDPQLNGQLLRTVNYAVGGSTTNIMAVNVNKLYFNVAYEGQIGVRLTISNSTETINLASTVLPRNE